MDFADLILTATSIGALFSGTVGLFALGEKLFMLDEDRARIRTYLTSRSRGAVGRHIPGDLKKVFNKIFGSSHWSTRSILSSSALFLISSVIVLIVLISNRFSYFSSMLAEGLSHYGFDPSELNLLGGFLLWILWSLAICYLNLFKTRIIIDWLEAGNNSIGAAIFALIADSLASITIIIAVLYCSLDAIFSFGLIPDQMFINLMWDFQSDGIPTSMLISELIDISVKGYSLISVAFYASIVPSLLLWLYIFSHLAVKFVGIGKRTENFFFQSFDLYEHPVRALGYISGIILSGIYLLGVILAAAIFV